MLTAAIPETLSTREVEEASVTDPELCGICGAIANGHFEKCEQNVIAANELCTAGYLVLRGTCVVPPQAPRTRVVHEEYLGIVGMKQHQRMKVCWPGMGRAAERYCKVCHGCKIVTRPGPPELQEPKPVADGPW